MTARWAYWCRELTREQALDAPVFARLRRAWPNLPDALEQWRIQRHPKGGALIVWPCGDNGAALRLEEFGEPRDTHDGLVYYPSLVAPTHEELIRAEQNRPPGVWIALANGGELYVALATETPRQLILRAAGGLAVGGYQNEYGQLAHELYEPFVSKAGIPPTDPRLGRLLFLCVRQSYFVTEESAEDLPWFTSNDLSPIVNALMGFDPKASAAAPAPSASRDRTTRTSRSPQRKRRPSTSDSRKTASRRR